jgi:Astacin (Peptidase family M12A)
MKKSRSLTLLLPILSLLMTSCPLSDKAPFSLLVPTNTSLEQGTSVELGIKVEPANGFASAVTLRLEGQPAGISYSFNPAVAKPGTTSTLRLTAGIGATLGTSKLSVLGEADGRLAKTNIDVSVALPKNFVEVSAPNPNNPAKTVKLPVIMENGVGIYQGDIVFPAARVQGASGKLSAQGTVMQSGYCAKRFAVCLDRAYLWPNKTVPYAFDSSATTTLRSLVQQAAQVYLERADIRLVPRTTESDYILVKGIPLSSSKGGDSVIGRLEGEQDLNLRVDAGLVTVLHEFGHALGLWHEQSRPDRDQYVTILSGNIQDDKEHNFELKDDPDVARANGPYDFDSIMHYPLDAFSKNKQPTIAVKNPSGVNVNKIGLHTELSPGDILALADLYNAPVTDGSIYLQVVGSKNLIAGGSRSVSILVRNDGPRTMQDLYFAISIANGIGLSATNSGLSCGAPANYEVICYTPGGIASGTFKRYGPIKITVPEGLATGKIELGLSLKPIGTRLANPSKAISSVTLCNINPPVDREETDSFTKPLGQLSVFASLPDDAIHVVADCDGKSLSRYTLHNKNDADYFAIDLSSFNPITENYAFEVQGEGNPSFEVYTAAGDRVPKDVIVTPGKYIVKVLGTEASLYSIFVNRFDPFANKFYPLDKRLLGKINPGEPIIKRFTNETDGFVITNKATSFFTLQSESGLVLRLFDQNNNLVLEQTSNVDNNISVQVPGPTKLDISEKYFRAEFVRQNKQETINNLTVDNPEKQYQLTAFK